MDPNFWHDRWQDGRIGFHEAGGNALFVRHFHRLAVPEGGRIFVPLSGKTRDIGWLLARGYRVVACELSEIAIQGLFEELGITPIIEQSGVLQHWSAPGLDVFVGDVFALSSGVLGAVDAVFDRAALVALPQDLRAHYAQHVTQITQAAPIFLVTFDYAPDAITGPPFSVPLQDVEQLYCARYVAQVLEEEHISFRSGAPATEIAVLLSPT